MPTAAARCAPHEPRGADDRVRIALSPPPLFLHAPPLLRPCAAGPRALNRAALTLRKLRRRYVPRRPLEPSWRSQREGSASSDPDQTDPIRSQTSSSHSRRSPPFAQRRRKDDRQAGDCAARPEGADAEPGQGLLHVRAQRRASLSPATTTRPSEAADTRCFCASLCCCLSPFAASIAAAACPSPPLPLSAASAPCTPRSRPSPPPLTATLPPSSPRRCQVLQLLAPVQVPPA